MDNDDMKYLIERLESVIPLMDSNKHMAAAKLLSIISATKGLIKEPTNQEAEKEFQKFWAAYGRKGNIKTARRKWFNLSRRKKSLAMDKVKEYVKSTPDKQYRKGGDSWLHNECWNDEIVYQTNAYGRPEVVRAIEMSKEKEEEKLAENDKLREANSGRNVKDILG